MQSGQLHSCTLSVNLDHIWTASTLSYWRHLHSNVRHTVRQRDELVGFLSYYRHVSLSCPPTRLTTWCTKYRQQVSKEVGREGYQQPLPAEMWEAWLQQQYIKPYCVQHRIKTAVFHPYGVFICFQSFSEYTAIISLTASTDLYNGASGCLLWGRTLRCVIPVVCVTNDREEKYIVEQHN